MTSSSMSFDSKIWKPKTLTFHFHYKNRDFNRNFYFDATYKNQLTQTIKDLNSHFVFILRQKREKIDNS